MLSLFQLVFTHLFQLIFAMFSSSSLDFLLLEKAALLDNFDNLPKLLAAISSSVGSSSKFRTSDTESNDTVIDLSGKRGIAALRLSLTSLEALIEPVDTDWQPTAGSTIFAIVLCRGFADYKIDNIAGCQNFVDDIRNTEIFPIIWPSTSHAPLLFTSDDISRYPRTFSLPRTMMAKLVILTAAGVNHFCPQASVPEDISTRAISGWQSFAPRGDASGLQFLRPPFDGQSVSVSSFDDSASARGSQLSRMQFGRMSNATPHAVADGALADSSVPALSSTPSTAPPSFGASVHDGRATASESQQANLPMHAMLAFMERQADAQREFQREGAEAQRDFQREVMAQQQAALRMQSDTISLLTAAFSVQAANLTTQETHMASRPLHVLSNKSDAKLTEQANIVATQGMFDTPENYLRNFRVTVIHDIDAVTALF